MELFDRIFVMHQILAAARRPVPIGRFLTELECAPATFKRIKARMIDYLDAPIKYDREGNGYYYDHNEQRFELPGMWFTPSELYALLAAEQLLERAEPGLFAKRLEPLKTRIQSVIRSSGMDPQSMRQRIHIAPLGQRRREEKTLGQVTEALLNRQRLLFHYRGRTRNRGSQREISPQRMLRYRDNWFLDAWCHGRGALRTFALDRMGQIHVVQQACREIDPTVLDAHVVAGYGLFAGPARHRAVLRFSGFAARWVADEVWHTDQRGQWLTDDRYELEVPYADHRELIMDILRYGPEVEVVQPQRLRRMAAERARDTAAIYRDIL